MDNRLAITETMLTLPTGPATGAYLESDGQAALEAENATQIISNSTHTWLTATAQSGYTGTSYLQALPDIDLLIPTSTITDTPTANYPIHFTTPGTYTVWSRASAPNAAGDSLYVGLNGQVVSVTGADPNEWNWANESTNGEAANLEITSSGLYTLTASIREDGLRIDRLLLTTDTTFIPSGDGPIESARQSGVSTETTLITRTIVYTYDSLYRLTDATYSTGEFYHYSYDAVGNRVGLTENTLISGTVVTTHTFDNANRLTDRVVSDGRVYSYTWSAKGEMLAEYTQGYPVRTFTYNGAGHLVEATVFTLTTVYTYNGDGVRVAMAVDGYGETQYTLDYLDGNRVLAETTTEGVTRYLYGESDQTCLGEETDGEWDYYLTDSSKQVRQTTNEAGDLNETWLYNPDGTVLEGSEGPITHLVCGGIYDWSTGLIYKGEGYFDPRLGIWLMMAPLGVIGLWRRRKRRGGFSGFSILLVIVCVSGLLVGCGGSDTPPAPPTVCTDTPVPAPTIAQFTDAPTPGLPYWMVAKGFVNRNYTWSSIHSPSFSSFLNGEIEKTTDITSLSCYDMILLAAIEAGEVEKVSIKDFFDDYDSVTDGTIALGGTDAEQILWQMLGAPLNTTQPIDDNFSPNPGQLVFFTAAPKTNPLISESGYHPGHVAIAIGGRDVISIYGGPNDISKVQQTTIDELKEFMAWYTKIPDEADIYVRVADPFWRK